MFDTRFVGYRFPTFQFEVERGKLREFAQAVGETDPIYQQREAARTAGYEDVQMLPTLPIQFEFWGNPGWMEGLRSLGLNTDRLLHAEQEFEYLGTIVPGDVLQAVTTVVDGKARRGIDMATLETRFTNQRGEHVLTSQMKVVVREEVEK